jgi:hypothetical protein
MIACPACNRPSYSSREMLGAAPAGGTRCPACGEVARLDPMSRCVVACALAMLLWVMVLYGNLFYSGYLFLFSTLVILAGWPLLSAAALPLLSLERSPDGLCLDRRQSVAMAAIMIACAVAIDAVLAYRSDADRAEAKTAAAEVRER